MELGSPVNSRTRNGQEDLTFFQVKTPAMALATGKACAVGRELFNRATQIGMHPSVAAAWPGVAILFGAEE